MKYRLRNRPTFVPKASELKRLQAAEVDLAAVVDAVERDGQFRVGAEQRVAEKKLARA